jgi:hypothetical protein
MRRTLKRAPGHRRSTARLIGPLRKGDLTRFGYAAAAGEEARHLALTSAMKEYGGLSLWRKLNAIYVLTRKRSPHTSAIFKADRDWVRAQAF